MILPWARVLISAGAHGLRRIPGQSVNLAHLIWRAPRAPAPLHGAPPVVFSAGLWVLGVVSMGNRKPNYLWERGWGEGLHSPKRKALLGGLHCVNHGVHAQRPPHPRPSPPLGARGEDLSTQNAVAAGCA